MFAERLKRARKASGLSMQALGREVGLSANAIKKYEHDEAMPSSGNLLKLASVLGVRTEYFFRPTQIALEAVEYRKHASVGARLLNRIDGDVVDQAERWAELLNLYPDSVRPIAPFVVPDGLPEKLSDMEEIETIAEGVRAAWQLGMEPIPSMIDVLEAKGVMVISTQVADGAHFDGLAARAGTIPVVVISGQRPGDRQRFTLAHELGHLVLRGRLGPGIDAEKGANRFAGAFLLPKPSLVARLGESQRPLEWRELYMLKQEFGISMMAILYRTTQCGITSDGALRQWLIRFGQLSWRAQEPGKAYPPESTRLFRQLVYRALAQEWIGESKAAELLGMSIADFHDERKLGAPVGSAHQ